MEKGQVELVTWPYLPHNSSTSQPEGGIDMKGAEVNRTTPSSFRKGHTGRGSLKRHLRIQSGNARRIRRLRILVTADELMREAEDAFVSQRK
jgi:hypothetical protein